MGAKKSLMAVLEEASIPLDARARLTYNLATRVLSEAEKKVSEDKSLSREEKDERLTDIATTRAQVKYVWLRNPLRSGNG